MENKILNTKMKTFCSESGDMAIFGKGPCQKVTKLHLYCHNSQNTCPKSIKITFLDSCCHELCKKYKFHFIPRRSVIVMSFS